MSLFNRNTAPKVIVAEEMQIYFLSFFLFALQLNTCTAYLRHNLCVLAIGRGIPGQSKETNVREGMNNGVHFKNGCQLFDINEDVH